MAESDNFGDSLVSNILHEKQTLWQQHSHLSEQERQQLWSRRAAHLTSILGTDAAGNNHAQTSYPQQLAHIPRSFSSQGSSMTRQESGCETLQGTEPIRNLSQQSAPAAISMSRTGSSLSKTSNSPFSSTGAHVPPLNSVSQPPPLSEWQSNHDEPFNAYTFVPPTSHRPIDSHRSQLSRVAEVSAEVYDPSEYISQLPEDLSATPGLSFTPSPASANFDSFDSSPHGVSMPLSNPLGTFANYTSPASPTTGEMSNGRIFASDMSRQTSMAGSSFCGGFDMLRFYSNASEFDMNGDQSLFDRSRSAAKGNDGGDVLLSENERSHFLLHAGGVGENAQFSHPSFPSCAVTAPSDSSSSANAVVEDMRRSLSDESNGSSASSDQDQSRSSRRRQHEQQQLAQAVRPIAPKQPNDAAAAASSIAMSTSRDASASAPKMLRIQSRDGSMSDDKLVAMIPKTAYVRPSHPRVMCKRCNDHPDGFRGEHELRRHTDRYHQVIRKVWVTVDISKDKKFLANCKACRSGKKYGVYYNAAAHLRRAHFNPRKRGRGKGKSDERRGGKGGGDHPPMDELKKWMREEEELVEDNTLPLAQQRRIDDMGTSDAAQQQEALINCGAPQMQHSASTNSLDSCSSFIPDPNIQMSLYADPVNPSDLSQQPQFFNPAFDSAFDATQMAMPMSMSVPFGVATNNTVLPAGFEPSFPAGDPTTTWNVDPMQTQQQEQQQGQPMFEDGAVFAMDIPQ